MPNLTTEPAHLADPSRAMEGGDHADVPFAFTLSPKDHAALPQALKERLPLAEAAANRNVRKAESFSRKLDSCRGLMHEAARPGVAKKSRVMMLRHVATVWSDGLAPVAACRAGCSHCCHIGVTVSETEAKLIASKTGRRIQPPLEPLTLLSRDSRSYGYDKPCVFLEQGRCSIYAHRPLVCRTLVNMDDDETLCRLVEEVSVPVPYANAIKMQALMGLATQADTFADIRDWFRS